jgi:hypothetical protein
MVRWILMARWILTRTRAVTEDMRKGNIRTAATVEGAGEAGGDIARGRAIAVVIDE